MTQVWEGYIHMKKADYRKLDNGKVEVYVIDDNDETEKLCYVIDKKQKMIEFYPDDDNYFVDTIYLDGFTTIPAEFSDKGYILGKIPYAFNSALKDKKITKFTISKDNKKAFRITKKGYNVTIPYNEFAKYKETMVSIDTESKLDRKKTTQHFFASMFPTHFEVEDDSVERKKRRFLSGLDTEIIATLKPNELEQLQEFVFNMLDKKYIDVSKKIDLITKYKDNVQILAIDEAIKGYEENLQKSSTESDWGKYIKKYMFLVETKYVRVISELNLSLCTWRKVDFAYIDNQGYLDIFEIKKPQANLLCKTDDRGNYYWHADAVKAITQAEKYLFSAERKGSQLAEDIKRETDLDVQVIKPRAFLIMGLTNQLTNKKMQDDFRILRNSLKNVEIITYDEFLDRLKTLKNRTSS